MLLLCHFLAVLSITVLRCVQHLMHGLSHRPRHYNRNFFYRSRAQRLRRLKMLQQRALALFTHAGHAVEL